MKGSLLLTMSRAIVNALGAVSLIVLARLLVPADFGIFAIATTMLAIIQSFTDLSVGQALIQRAEVERRHIDTAWTMSALRGVLLGAGLALAAPALAALYDEPRLSAVLMALGGSLALSGLTSPRLILLQKNLHFWQASVVEVAQKSSGVLSTIIFAALYQSYWALVAGAIVTQLAQTIASYVLAPYRPRISFSEVKSILSFSGWLSLGEIVNTLNWRADYLILGKFVSARDVGYYSVGSNLALLPTREAITPLTKTLYPGLASVASDFERLRRGYQRTQAVVTAVSLPVGVGTALISAPLVVLLMGERWIPAIFIVQTLSLIYAIQTIGTQVQPLAMALGKTKALFSRNLQMLLIRMPIVIAGLAIWGIQGMVIARVIAGLIGVFINMSLVRTLIGLTIAEQLHANARAIVSTIAMAAVLALADQLLPTIAGHTGLVMRVVVAVVLGAGTYVSLSYALWIRAGRPVGPEATILQAMTSILRRLRILQHG